MVAVIQQQTKRNNKAKLERKGCPKGQNSSDGFGDAIHIYMVCRVAQLAERMNDIWAKEDPQHKLALMPEVIYHL